MKVFWLDGGFAIGEWPWLDDCRCLGNPHRQRAMADGHLRDANILTDDHGTGALVEHNAGRRGRLHRQILDSRDEPRCGYVLRLGDRDGARIDLAGRVHAVLHGTEAVDRVGDGDRRGEIWIAQLQGQRVFGGEVGLDLPFHDRAAGNESGGRRSARNGLGLTLGLETGDRDRALSDGIDLAIGGAQRRHHQLARRQAMSRRPSEETETSIREP